MTYIGRIIGIIFAFTNLFIWIFHLKVFHEKTEFRTFQILFLVPFTVLGWWLGKIYDKSRLQSKELRRTNQKFQTIFEKAGIGIALLDRKGRPVVSNPKLQEMFGYSEEELRTMTLDEFSHPDDHKKNMNLIEELLEGKIDYYLIEKRYIRKDGQIVWGKVTSTLLQDENDRVTHIIGMVNDITERKVAEHKLIEANRMLEYLSNKDSLTGIANRRNFDEYLAREWRRAIRFSIPMSLIMLDIDFFKDFNDTYGHHSGDYCLKQVAGVLESTVNRPTDLVARLGGEEFAVILPETDLKGAYVVAERLRSAVEAQRIPHEHSKNNDVVTISAGVACMTPDSGSKVEDLMIRADNALYQSKNAGRNTVNVHSDLE